MGRQLSHLEIEVCANAAHEVNRAYCRAMDDHSHAPWSATPSHLQRVAKQAVIGIATNDYNAQQSHDAWVAAKLADGWRHGEIKSDERKEHPCLVEWEALPFEQRAKDELWVSTVKNMLDAFWRLPQ